LVNVRSGSYREQSKVIDGVFVRRFRASASILKILLISGNKLQQLLAHATTCN
jgi:hypothetical protein